VAEVSKRTTISQTYKRTKEKRSFHLSLMVNDYSQLFNYGLDNPVLYCNGDSFTWGTGIGNQFAHPQFDFKKFDESRLYSTWPGVLGESLGWKFINDAWAGGSNRRIIRRTKKFFKEIQDCQEVKVIISWSTAIRVEYARPVLPSDTEVPYIKQGRTGPYDIEGDITYVQVHQSGLTSPTYISKQDKSYLKEFYLKNNDADLFIQYLEDIINLQDFLKERNVDYIFFNAFGNKELYKDNVQDTRIYPLLDKIDFECFMGWPEEDFCVWAYMRDPKDILPDGHLGVASHKHLAVLLKDKMKELSYV